MKSFFQQRIWNLIRLFFARNFVAILFLLEQTNLTEKQIFSGSKFNFLTRHFFSSGGREWFPFKTKGFFQSTPPVTLPPLGKQRVRWHLWTKHQDVKQNEKCWVTWTHSAPILMPLLETRPAHRKLPRQCKLGRKKDACHRTLTFLSDSSNGNFFLAPIIFQARNFLKSA